MPNFGRQHAGIGLDFLDCIHVEIRERCAPHLGVRRIEAIHREDSRYSALPIHRELLGEVSSAICIRHRAGRQQQQFAEIAGIQRQAGDLRAREAFAPASLACRLSNSICEFRRQRTHPQKFARSDLQRTRERGRMSGHFERKRRFVHLVPDHYRHAVRPRSHRRKEKSAIGRSWRAVLMFSRGGVHLDNRTVDGFTSDVRKHSAPGSSRGGIRGGNSDHKRKQVEPIKPILQLRKHEPGIIKAAPRFRLPEGRPKSSSGAPSNCWPLSRL